MEIMLTKDWDLQLTTPSSVPAEERNDEGFFIGRRTIVDLIKNDILNKNQGSILIAGHRGVGKTTLVYKAIHEAGNAISEAWKDNTTAGKSKPNLLFIPINAGQFSNTFKSQKIDLDPETIIKVIIRRLYASFKSAESRKIPMPKYISELYNKAIAKEYKLQENFGRLIKESRVTTKETELKIDLKDIGKKQIIQLTCFLAGAGFIFFTPLQNTILNQVLGLIAAFPLPFVINAYIRYLETKTKNEENISNAELLYQIDNSLENLEYDLDDAHRRLNSDQWKIVYVIDELDKLGDIENVSKVIKYFKNMFTLSKATFIFIGNEDIYKAAKTEEHTKKNIDDPAGLPEYRPEEYTYFTSKYFVSRPGWDEMQDYLESIVNHNGDDPQWKNVFHFLGYESGNDYYNLKNVIKDNIQGFEGGFPILSVNIDSPEAIRKSRFHKCQEVLYGKKYFKAQLGYHYENETLFRELFKYSNQINLSPAKTEFRDPEAPDIVSAIKRDFNNFLSKLEVLSFKEEKILSINGVDFPLGKYTYNGYFKEDPPDQLNILSENETRFTSVFSDFVKKISPVVTRYLPIKPGEDSIENLPSFIARNSTLLNQLPAEILRPEPAWTKLFSELTKEPPEVKLSRDEVESGESKIKERVVMIEDSYFQITLQLVAANLQPDYISTVTTTGLNNYNFFVEFYGKEIVAAIEKKEIGYFHNEKTDNDHFLLPYSSRLAKRYGYGPLHPYFYLLRSAKMNIDPDEPVDDSLRIDTIQDCILASDLIVAKIRETDQRKD